VLRSVNQAATSGPHKRLRSTTAPAELSADTTTTAPTSESGVRAETPAEAYGRPQKSLALGSRCTCPVRITAAAAA
jgi:hypothetical protein